MTIGNKPENGIILKEMVDRDTGEIYHVPIFTRSTYKGGNFFMAMQEGFIHLAKLGLRGQEMQVLMLVMGKLDFENWIRVSQAEIARELDLDRSIVSKAIKKLVTEGILHKGPKVGTSSTYRLDPGFGLKGRAKNQKKIRDEIKHLSVIEGKKK
ncbi:MarR family transcriptional regulator [Metabacillus rhizolycopersici]|uniref:Replication/maintenance protein RepL n=1 Tax=Metabacillus rhizolycopersici TaxID=2875709 RepID=A0ABS7UZM2_9BACI|nr:replication/maintenance protein RepL [Metabacillus rhizolycopersici]MBZ5753709.1 replication/maintenance protein RepL [Metabacillus rhizolycopersici]